MQLIVFTILIIFALIGFPTPATSNPEKNIIGAGDQNPGSSLKRESNSNSSKLKITPKENAWLKAYGIAALVFALGMVWLLQLRRQNKRLRMNEERFQQAMSVVSESVWEWNVKTGERHFTPILFLRLGYQPEDIPATDNDYMSLIHPDDRAHRLEILAKSEQDDTLLSQDYRIRRADGSYAHVVVAGKVTARDRQGDPTKRTGTIQDITAQKQAESQFKDLINALPIAVAVADYTGRILLDNPQARREVGVSTSLIGCNTKEFYVNAEDRDKILALFAEKGGITGHQVQYRLHSGGIIECLLSVLPVRFDGQDALLGVVINLTERIKMEQNLAEAKHAAEQASRSKSEFLANMSHEIRTPMNAILGFSELLKSLDPTPKQQDFLERIHRSARSLLTIINDILDLSKIEAGKLELEYGFVCIKTLLRDIEMIFSQKANAKDLRFIVEIDETFPNVVILDETRLHQIMLNLVGNAIKFTDKGFIKLTATYQQSDSHLTELTLSVEDSGKGIPEDQHSEIFNAFEQVKSQSTTYYGGTGLGLSISKKLIELMNGSISVTSKVEQGATFTCRFRDVEISSHNDGEETTEISPETYQFEEASILIVDDTPFNLDLLAGLLANFNFHLRVAENGQQAVEKARQEKPDLVLMDMMMPVMGGAEAIRRFKADQSLKAIPIIALTAAESNQVEDSILEQCEGFVAKPIDSAILFKQISYILPGRRK